MKKIKDNLFSIYIIINLMIIFVSSFLFSVRIIEYKVISYEYIILSSINIFLLIYIFKNNKYKKNIIDIFLLLIIIFAIISTIFAYRPDKALFGEFYRYEGLLTIIYYISIFFISNFVENKNKIIYVIIMFCIIETLYAFMQKFAIIPTTIHKGDLWAKGFLLNPNFLGTLLLIGLSYSIGFYIESNEIKRRILYLMVTFILFIGLLLTNALSCIVGLIIVMIVLLIYSINYKYIKKYFILCLTLFLTLLFIHFIDMTTIISDVIRTNKETTNIIKGDYNNNYGTGRIDLWKKTIPLVPKYLLHGVGVDNFGYVLDGKPISRSVSRVIKYDKAHNEYLQILITMGVFSLISYLSLHFIIIKNGIKNTFKNKEIYLILPVIGYIVQAQFNISVIEVAPIFYISLGLLVDRGNV